MSNYCDIRHINQTLTRYREQNPQFVIAAEFKLEGLKLSISYQHNGPPHDITQRGYMSVIAQYDTIAHSNMDLVAVWLSALIYDLKEYIKVKFE